MKEIKPTTVYVPVSVGDEMPEAILDNGSDSFFILDDSFADGCYTKKVSWFNGNKSGQSLFTRRPHSIKWLKEQSGYLFSEDEHKTLKKEINESVKEIASIKEYIAKMRKEALKLHGDNFGVLVFIQRLEESFTWVKEVK